MRGSAHASQYFALSTFRLVCTVSQKSPSLQLRRSCSEVLVLHVYSHILLFDTSEARIRLTVPSQPVLGPLRRPCRSSCGRGSSVSNLCGAERHRERDSPLSRGCQSKKKCNNDWYGSLEALLELATAYTASHVHDNQRRTLFRAIGGTLNCLPVVPSNVPDLLEYSDCVERRGVSVTIPQGGE